MNLKKAFTLIEMIVTIVIIWIWLIWVISILIHSYKFLFNVSTRVTAINLAREGMEWVFSIRNTNWIRWWWKKDKCWLKINPLSDWWDGKCENDAWFGSGSYILLLTGNKQKYFYLSGMVNSLLLSWNIVSTDWQYLLCTGDNLIQACPSNKKPNNYFSPALFFRQIRWGYLINKNKTSSDNNFFLNCNNWEWPDSECWTSIFKEKNFCVDIVYFGWKKSKVTFCSVLTNFKQ